MPPRKLQPLLAPEVLNLLVVDLPALDPQQFGYLAVALPAIVPGQLWKPTTAGAIARNEAERASKYLARALWRKLTAYHRRSRAETKMNCVKLLGQGVLDRELDRQDAELQIRIPVLDRYTARGVPVTVPVG